MFSPISDPTILLASRKVTFFWTSPTVFFSFFYKCHKILRKRGGGVIDILDIEFYLSNLYPRGRGPFHHTLYMFDVLCNLSVVTIFLTFETPLGRWNIFQPSRSNTRLFNSLGIWSWLKVRMYVLVWICSLLFLIIILFKSMNSCFPVASVISFPVAKGLFVMTPFEVFNFS